MVVTQAPLFHDGAQSVAAFDARSSTVTGTTLAGPGGSGQFLMVRLSTTVDRTIQLTTVAGMLPYGVLLNRPSTGTAADVGIFGISRVVAGSSLIVGGQQLMTSSTLAGVLIPFSTAVGQVSCARALESATAVGQIFSAALYGFGMGVPGGV